MFIEMFYFRLDHYRLWPPTIDHGKIFFFRFSLSAFPSIAVVCICTQVLCLGSFAVCGLTLHWKCKEWHVRLQTSTKGIFIYSCIYICANVSLLQLHRNGHNNKNKDHSQNTSMQAARVYGCRMCLAAVLLNTTHNRYFYLLSHCHAAFVRKRETRTIHSTHTQSGARTFSPLSIENATIRFLRIHVLSHSAKVGVICE